MSADTSQRGPFSSPSHKFQFVRWHPPPPGVIKINFDGSRINSTTAGGYILRDWTDKVLKIGAANYGHSSVLVAEARALRDGIRTARQAGFTRLCIEGDNRTVIQALQGSSSTPWKISTIMDDVRTWMQSATQVQVKHIYREANMAADWLSKFGHTTTDWVSSDKCFSSALGTILTTDVVGRTLVRRCA